MSDNTAALDTAALPGESIVDESSISPTATGRDVLEKRLAQRPDAQALKDRHILLDTTAAPYVPALEWTISQTSLLTYINKSSAVCTARA